MTKEVTQVVKFILFQFDVMQIPSDLASLHLQEIYCMFKPIAYSQKQKRFNAKQDARRHGMAHMSVSLKRLANVINDASLSLEVRRDAERRFTFLKEVYQRTDANLKQALESVTPPKVAA